MKSVYLFVTWVRVSVTYIALTSDWLQLVTCYMYLHGYMYLKQQVKCLGIAGAPKQLKPVEL